MKKSLKRILIILVILCISGCKRNSIIKEKELEKVSNKNKLIVVDVKEQFEERKQVKEAYVLDSGKNWQIEYYIFDTKENAKEMFEKNKNDFKSLKSKKDKEEDKETIYTTTTNDYYMYISIIDNSVLYIKVPTKVKDEAKEIIKELKY